MPCWLERFGAVELPGWNTETPIGTAETADALVGLPGGRYHDPYGEVQAPLRLPEEIELRGTIADEADADALWDALNALKGMRGRRDVLWRRSVGMTRQWCWARLLRVRGERRVRRNTGLMQEVSLLFRRLSEWYGTLTDSSAGSGASPDGRAELATTGADQDNAVSSGTTLSLWVNGNADVTAVQLTVTPSAEMTDFVWANAATGSELSFAGTVAAGKTLAIDGGTVSALNDGAAAAADLTPPQNDEEWLRLAPGVNAVTVSWVGGGSAQIGVVFRDAWE